MFKIIFALFLLAATAVPIFANGAITYVVDEAFSDVEFAVESAIVGRGYVIDSTSHVSNMLDRTQADVGATKQIFDGASVFGFCSATLSREVMETDPANIRFCPYRIFVYSTADNPGQTIIGHDPMPEGEMKKVEALLSSIAKEAAGLE